MADGIFRAFAPFPGGSARWVTTDPAGDIARESFFGAPAPGGGASPVIYRDHQWSTGTNFTTCTWAAMAVGPAASDRWVIAALNINHNTSRAISTVSIGGVSATKLYAAPSPRSDDGVSFEFWAANVPTGTTADVVATAASNQFWDGAAWTYTCTGEPIFHDGEVDQTIASNTFSVAIDVAEGGAVIALVNGDEPASLSAWAGVTSDFTDEGRELYTASADELTAETGRTVSWTGTGAPSPATTFYGLGVLSVSFAGSGGATATLAATEGPDIAAVALTARHTASLAANEGADTASIALTAAHTASLAATEAPDIASVTIGDVTATAALDATEGPDVAAIAATARHTAAIAATEGQDTAAIALTARHTAALAATEASDAAAFAITARHTATLAATEVADTAAFTIGDLPTVTATLGTTEGRDAAAFTVVIAATLQAPIQGGWGTYDTREDEKRQRQIERDRRAEDQKRRKAVEQAFRALDVQPETPEEPIAPQVRAEIRAVALPKIDMAGIGASLNRLDAMIEALWAEQQAELTRAIEAEAERWRQQEEEALIALLMVA